VETLTSGSVRAWGCNSPGPLDWWSRSLESKCTCSLLSIAKARFLKFSFSPNLTRPALRLFRKLFRRQGFFPTVQ